MGIKRGIIFLSVVFLLVGSAGSLFAENVTPGSCILFPYYDTTDATLSIHSIMNVGTETESVRFVFIDETTCTPMDIFLQLTPGDTFTFVAGAMTPEKARGFMYAYVVQPLNVTLEKKSDCLVGQQLVFGLWDDERLVNFSVNAVSFQAVKLKPDGKLHLDGDEYTCAPSKLYFPRFFAQEADVYSRLILINLTGGKYFKTSLDVILYNDNESPFSDYLEIGCFKLIRLTDLSPMTEKNFLLSSNHSPMEPWPFYSMVETGAFILRGMDADNGHGTVISNASIYAVLVEGIGTLGSTVADLPFQITDHTLYTNAMLWSVNTGGT